MPTSKEYWEHAQQCLELAKEAEDFYVKSALIELAEKFKKQAEKNKRPVSRTSRGTLVRRNTLSETAAPMVLTEPPSQAFVIAGVLVAVGGG